MLFGDRHIDKLIGFDKIFQDRPDRQKLAAQVGHNIILFDRKNHPGAGILGRFFDAERIKVLRASLQ